MREEIYLGIDIGASSFKFGLVSHGIVVKELNLVIDAKLPSEVLLFQLINEIKKIWHTDIRGIGVGVPGIVDTNKGLIVDLQNIPSWSGLPLADLLIRDFGVPVALNNDAHCFALGEHCFGGASDWQNFVGITLGTGLGMGIVINGQLYKGALSGAGELGMLPYKQGIIEDYTASAFFTKQYNETAHGLYSRAQLGDSEALSAFESYGKHLGEAVKIGLSILAPEGVIFGGSIAQAWPYFSDGLMASISTFPYTKQLEHFSIRQSASMDSAILGAVALLISKDC